MAKHVKVTVETGDPTEKKDYVISVIKLPDGLRHIASDAEFVKATIDYGDTQVKVVFFN